MGPSALWHFFKNLFLIVLSVLYLPIDTFVALAAIVSQKVVPSKSINNNGFKPVAVEDRKTVLVTGVNMAKGLSIARLLYRRGHRVIGADFHSLSIGRVSRALEVFHHLPHPPDCAQRERSLDDPYLNRLLEIVEEEDVDLWISVSDVAAAIEDAIVKEIVEARTKAKVIQLGVKDVQTLHEKDSFMEHVRSLSLPVPDTEIVRTKQEAVEFLQERGGLQLRSGGSQYLLKPINVDDLARLSMPLLPLSSETSTLTLLDSIPFSTTSSSLIFQEFIAGHEFCTHALVISGRVRAFVACPSAAVLMHYTALPMESMLSQAMLEFTEELVREGGEGFTGHVSFDFLVRSGCEEKGVVVYPIECNPRVHTAIVLFNDTPQLVDEFLSVLSASPRDKMSTKPPIVPSRPQHYYWVGQDLIENVLYPCFLFLIGGNVTFEQLFESTRSFIQHLLYWKDGTFEAWDPWPWWWLYHVYWPARFVGYLGKGSWQKLNVSTGKAFKAS